MKILITGSEGFFGSHLVEKFLSQGFEVTCFVQYNSFSSLGWLQELAPTFPEIESRIQFGDIRDIESISKALSSVDICINLAALIAIPYSFENPRSYFETNVLGTFNVMESCLKSNVKRVIHVSTSEVYGTPKYTPISEDHAIQTQSPYAASKAAADHLVTSYFHSFGLPVVILRPFNLFGPRQSTRAVIPSIITQAMSQNRIKVGALTPRREFNFAPEVANAFLNVALSEKGIGEVFNVGNGTDLSIGEVIEYVLQLTNRKCEVVQDAQRIRPNSSEVLKLQSDSTKLLKTFGWKYSNSGKDGFLERLENTIAWYAKEENRSKFNSKRYGI